MPAYKITLPENTPNFEITTVIDDENLQIKIRTLNNRTYMSLTCNNQVIFSGLRCDSNINLTESFNYKGIKGKLIFLSESAEPVYYTGFGSSYELYYITN